MRPSYRTKERYTNYDRYLLALHDAENYPEGSEDRARLERIAAEWLAKSKTRKRNGQFLPGKPLTIGGTL